jgi:hypothetical protein
MIRGQPLFEFDYLNAVVLETNGKFSTKIILVATAALVGNM